MPNIILEDVDTFVFAFGLSADLEAQYSAGDCGKSDFEKSVKTVSVFRKLSTCV